MKLLGQLKSVNRLLYKAEQLVPEVGIEPTRGCPRRILNPVRLPISPLRHIDFKRVKGVLRGSQ